MKQNIYDNPTFFDGYSNLRQNESGLNAALEIPAMRSLLPSFQGKRVLDLGCGTGDLCRLAFSEGAIKVVGVDISKNMLDIATQSTTKSSVVSYICCAIEDFSASADQFDVVVSSLAVHYVADWSEICDNVSKWLACSGNFIFSMEHPLCTAAMSGWIKSDDGARLHWPVDRYRDEGQRTSRWFVDGVLKYHRTIETILNTLTDNELQICKVLEPEPIPEAIALRPELKDDRRRPPFLIIKAKKN